MRKIIFGFIVAILSIVVVPAQAEAMSDVCVSKFEWNYVHRHDLPRYQIHREFDFAGHQTFYFEQTAGSESEDYPVILRSTRQYRACGGGSYKIRYSRLVYPDGTHDHWFPSWSKSY